MPGWLLVCLLTAAATAAQTPDNVLVVVNRASAASKEIGQRYAAARSIPPEQVFEIDVPAADAIRRDQYVDLIEAPLRTWFTQTRAHDRILFIVLTKGVPLRVSGSGGRSGTAASVDSELTLLYRRMTGRPVPPAGPLPNPYYLGETAVALARPFSHADQDIFLVTRLDGFTVGDVAGLIDRARAPRPSGRIVLDGKAVPQDGPNGWLREAAERLKTLGLGDRLSLDTADGDVKGVKDVIGLASWGVSTVRAPAVTFEPGAVATFFASNDARTFDEPPADWLPGAWRDQRKFYVGAADMLTADVVRAGATGVIGQAGEAYADGTARPDVFLPAYLSGFTLAEAAYLSLPQLSWQAVVVGDPLMRLKPGPPAPTPSAEPDEISLFPRFFSDRRVDEMQEHGVSRDALRYVLRADALGLRKDLAGAAAALEKATEIEPRLIAAQLALATAYEQLGNIDAAEARYRTVLAQNSTNPVALNNLAFLLAVRRARPADALPLAERAYTIRGSDPFIADTLGWIHHLLGESETAARFIGEAVRGTPLSADVRLHAAAVYLALDRRADAARELAKALELDTSIGSKPEYNELRQKLDAPRP